MKISNLNRSLLAGAIAVALSPLPAFAADGLDEVIVTARRTNESLQETPVAVSAFTREAMATKGIQDINQLAAFTPGFSFSQAFGRQTDRPVVRGQSNILAGVQFGVESGTAYFIDGVYYNGDIQALDFDSLQRVEVIKGPQSALYGRNTYAGAINFITRDPGNEMDGSIKMGYASHSTSDISGSFSMPIIADKLAIRVNGKHHEYGGEYTNSLTGKKVGTEQDTSVSSTLVFTPSENFKARLFTTYRKQDDGVLALVLQGANFNNCAPGFRSTGYRGQSLATGNSTLSAAGGQLTPLNNTNQYYCGTVQARPQDIALNTEALSANGFNFLDGTAFDGIAARDFFGSLAMTWNLEGTGWTLSSLTGYRRKYDLFGSDSDHSAVSLFGSATSEPLFANTNRNNTKEWSQEFKLSSPADRKIRGAVGFYHYHNDDREKDLTFQQPYYGVYNANGNVTGIKNKAVFASLAMDITSTLTANFEVRNAKEEKKRIEFASAAGANANLIDGTALTPIKASYSKTTPRLTVDWKVRDGLMVYAVASKGAKPGGINGSAGLTIGKGTYTMETSNNFELGVKSSWLDNRLRANFAVYHTKAKDVQVTQALPAASGGTAVTSIAVNQGGAKIKGFEADIQAVLGAGFTAQYTLSFTDSKFTSGCDDFEYVLNSGGYAYPAALAATNADVQAKCSIAGHRLPLVPKVQSSLSLTYDRAINDSWSFVGSTTGTYESSKFVQVHNLAETGTTTEIGLRLGLRNEHWSITAYGKNLTDEDSIPMATRWFDLRYGTCSAAQCRGPAGVTPAATTPLSTPAAYGADRGTVRGLFYGLRKGRSFGIDVRYDF